MAEDAALKDHQAWIGYLQPDGLVVSAAALVDSGVVIDRGKLAEHQQAFTVFTHEIDIDEKSARAIVQLADFLCGFLEWRKEYLAGLDGIPIPDELSVPLSEFGETLTPTFALKNPKPADGEQPWLILIKQLPNGTDLDAAHSGQDERWSASASRRFERLLRETRISIGLISNGTSLRLMYAPHGENSGTVTFPIGAMCEVAGRPILGALHLLLRSYRLYTAPSEERLTALLKKSREYQSSVSTKLAGQVLDTLYELLRGFQAANEKAHGELLKEQIENAPDEIYVGLLTVLLRLVFLLYAEDRDVMPRSPLYVQNYSVHGLFEKLRADFERYPDTIDQRYGAWARLLALFRAVYGGSKHPQLKMPARKGFLFDPERYPFLEGRAGNLQGLPLLSDGVIFRVLRNLLILDGERLSYRTLDVEQIGSVYERMMGFKIELTEGSTVAVRAAKTHGAPTAINLDTLLAEKPAERAKWLSANSDQKLNPKAAEDLKQAASVDDLLVALENRIARNATPHPVPKGAIILQPSDERRRSSSHYTPRSFTAPIVERALKPVFEDLGANPTPSQILDLKVCDPAVGSGAFLVEACRQLGEELVRAWHRHNQVPFIPPDEDETLLARRIVAQRCLYAVDRNPIAVDLAKLSLWLATLAREHPFTFLDHNLKCGDSLVGLSRRQLGDFHWRDEPRRVLGQDQLEKRIQLATARRKEILEADDELVSAETKRQKLDLADEALEPVRQAGSCVIAAFFSSDKEKDRLAKRDEMLRIYSNFPKTFKELDAVVAELPAGTHPIRPFHWEIEFPEVLDRENAGFDAIVGNPPFAGKNTLIESTRQGYTDWLKVLHQDSHGAADLVAHFFRRSFSLLRERGAFGLIATNTISQGDTRTTGLRWICTHGGTIYAARRRYKWPGQAAVVVSVVWLLKGPGQPPFDLDGNPAHIITAYLFHAGTHENPAVLIANAETSFKGCEVGSLGFLITPNSPEFAWLSEVPDPRNPDLKMLKPYLGGEDLNSSPAMMPPRRIVDSDGLTAAQMATIPRVRAFLESRVRADRLQRRVISAGTTEWWHFRRPSLEYRRASARQDRVLGISEVTSHCNFAFVPTTFLPAHTLKLFGFDSFAAFAVLQSRLHEIWARFFGSSMKDDLRYTPSDCFETYPFPESWESAPTLEAVGKAYYEFRAGLMIRNDEGLTKTYNRFHEHHETSSDIIRLRQLHDELDRAVLDAYRWADIPTGCAFLLDYEDEEDGGESRRRKPWRYRWPDETRDAVLARLLALNAQHAEQERLSGAALDGHSKKNLQSRRANRLAQSEASFHAVKVEE